MRYLTVEEVASINAEVLGAEGAIHDQHMLESACYRPQSGFGGIDQYETLTDKGAALMHSLILNHPFVDGNKRTATIAVQAFLSINGRLVIYEPEQALEFITEIAKGNRDIPQIAEWLETVTR